MVKEKPTSFTKVQEKWMQSALAEARLAFALGEVPVGAVVVKDDIIIGRGHNLRESLKDPCAHAEILALRNAGASLGDWRLLDADIYVTLEPCPMCTAAMVQGRIRKVFYALADPRLGACGSFLNLAQFPGFDHDIAISGGLLAEESHSLLKEFFAKER